MPRRRAPIPIRLVILAVLGTALIASVVGYVHGQDLARRTFSLDQSDYIRGLITGTKLRSKPDAESRCAGEFWPHRPYAMRGCLAGLSDPPPGGYQLG